MTILKQIKNWNRFPDKNLNWLIFCCTKYQESEMSSLLNSISVARLGLCIKGTCRISRTLVFTFAALLTTLALSTHAVETMPILWHAGGLSAGNDSAGQAAHMAVDVFGNVAIVSGPSLAVSLAVTSYTSSGSLRWQNSVSPTSGTFVGSWVAAALNGDFVAVGVNLTSSGSPVMLTLVRFDPDGNLLWREDVIGTLPSVGRLLVDAAGNTYLAFSSVGDGQDIQLHKYSPSGILLWSQLINTGFFSNNYATSLALSADQTEVVLTGDTVGGTEWITALYDTSTGSRKWLVVAPEGSAALDVAIDASQVYVTGQGSVGINSYLTVVAYDRATGERLWRTDKNPPNGSNGTGIRMAMAPDGSLVVTGMALVGFLDWYTVGIETNGTVSWEAVRDGGLNTDEIPAAVLVLDDGTTVVTGRGGPNLPGGFWPGVTVGYSSAGTLLWEGFSPLPTVSATALPNGDVCATGGYDAYVACFRPSGTGDNIPPIAVVSATPLSGTASLNVTFDASASSDPDGSVDSWTWAFGDGATATGSIVQHVYTTAGTYTATVTVTDTLGATDMETVIIIVNAPSTLHIADLDGSAISVRRMWTATVTVTVQDDSDALVSGATVSGTWRLGAIGSCTTTTNGTCSVSRRATANREVFTVTGIMHASLTYDANVNADPDGDSNGTVITIFKP
jgi:PKD repeat protein